MPVTLSALDTCGCRRWHGGRVSGPAPAPLLPLHAPASYSPRWRGHRCRGLSVRRVQRRSAGIVRGRTGAAGGGRCEAHGGDGEEAGKGTVHRRHDPRPEISAQPARRRRLLEPQPKPGLSPPEALPLAPPLPRGPLVIVRLTGGSLHPSGLSSSYQSSNQRAPSSGFWPTRNLHHTLLSFSQSCTHQQELWPTARLLYIWSSCFFSTQSN